MFGDQGQPSLEVILNGDSLTPTRDIVGIVQPVAPTTAKQRLARKNKLKARGTLLMALLDKHQLKFNIHKDARNLMKKNMTDLKDQNLDDLFNSLKIYEAEVKSSFSASTSIQNIAFVSSQNTNSTNESVSAIDSVSPTSAKILVSPLPNVDTLSNAVMTGRNLRENRPTSMGFDMSKVECYNCHKKGHFARECRSPKDIKRNVPVKPQRRNVLAEEEPTNYTLMAFTSSSSSSSDNEVFSSETDESFPASPIYDRYQAGEGYRAVPPPYTGTFMPPKPDLVFHDAPNVNKTIYTAFNVKLSPTKPKKDLSHTHRPSAPIIEDWVSDSEDDSEAELPQNAPGFVQPTEQLKPPRPFVSPVDNSILATNHKSDIPNLKAIETARVERHMLFPRYWIYYLKIRGNLSSLAVGKSSGSGNSSLAVGRP
nr:hypothetical protein [Tanacetum cinerariifolium]